MSETPNAPRSYQETVDKMKRMILDYRDAKKQPIDLSNVRHVMRDTGSSASYVEGYLWQHVTAYPDLQVALIQLLAEDREARGEQDYFSYLAQDPSPAQLEGTRKLLPAQLRPVFEMRLNQVLAHKKASK